MNDTVGKTFKIGKYEITQQGYITFVTGTILSVSVFVSSFIMSIETPQKQGYVLGTFLLACLIFGYTCYVTYVTNCLVVGNCKVLAYIFVILFIFGIITTFFRLNMLNKK
jgi:hypothetical protein